MDNNLEKHSTQFSHKPSKVEYITQRFNIITNKLHTGPMIDELAKLTYDNQISHEPGVTMELARNAVLAVLNRRETQHALVEGIQLDVLSENHLLDEPLQSIVFEDRSTFGNDEILAEGITGTSGTISTSNFGLLDREKPGIIGLVDKLGKEDPDWTTTYLDDLLCAIVSSAAGKIAHTMDMGHDQNGLKFE